MKLTMWDTFFTINVEVMSWPFAFYLFSRHYGNKPTWPMLILNLFESHKLFAPFLKLTAFEPDDASLWHQFSAVGEIWFSTQTRGQIYISYSLKPKTWKSELIRIPYICCPSFDLPEEKLKYLLQIWKRREGITKTANTRSAFEKSAGIKNPGSAALLTSLLRAGSGLLSESGRQINLFRGLKRHKFPQRANTEPSVILFCRRWMKEEIGGGGGWLRHHEGKWGCDLILVFPKPQSGRQPAPPLSLKVQKSAREIWSDALGKIWCKQAQELQIQIVKGANIKKNGQIQNTKGQIQNTEDKYKTPKVQIKTQKGREIPINCIIYGLEMKLPDKSCPLVVVLTIFLQILEEVIWKKHKC